MKHLVLPIKKKWYDMILSGEKKEEYREMKDYYRTRFAHLFIDINTGETMRPERLDEWLVTSVRFKRFIIFRNGYRTDSPSFGATCTFKIGAGKPEWGAEPGKKYYVLKIERIMRDYKPMFFCKTVSKYKEGYLT